jgi:hypothetical protein
MEQAAGSSCMFEDAGAASDALNADGPAEVVMGATIVTQLTCRSWGEGSASILRFAGSGA